MVDDGTAGVDGLHAAVVGAGGEVDADPGGDLGSRSPIHEAAEQPVAAAAFEVVVGRPGAHQASSTGGRPQAEADVGTVSGPCEGGVEVNASAVSGTKTVGSEKSPGQRSALGWTQGRCGCRRPVPGRPAVGHNPMTALIRD